MAKSSEKTFTTLLETSGNAGPFFPRMKIRGEYNKLGIAAAVADVGLTETEDLYQQISVAGIVREGATGNCDGGIGVSAGVNAPTHAQSPPRFEGRLVR